MINIYTALSAMLSLNSLHPSFPLSHYKRRHWGFTSCWRKRTFCNLGVKSNESVRLCDTKRERESGRKREKDLSWVKWRISSQVQLDFWGEKWRRSNQKGNTGATVENCGRGLTWWPLHDPCSWSCLADTPCWWIYSKSSTLETSVV